jgi:hypothetical protein
MVDKRTIQDWVAIDLDLTPLDDADDSPRSGSLLSGAAGTHPRQVCQQHTAAPAEEDNQTCYQQTM